MASDKITEIVDQSAFAQVDKLKLDLKALTDQFVQLFGGVEQFKKALATASTGGGLSGGITKVTSQMTELEKVTRSLAIAKEKQTIIDHALSQELREVQAELKKETQARKDATKAMQAEEGSYDQMEATLKKLTLQYKAMGTANLQAFGKDKLAEIQKYEAALQSLDKGMGKFNRNVGNYQNQTFQLSQVFREIPAFTYSATTGILALSNNLPMLADGFKQVATATNDATGKVNGTMGALKIFAKSIFSWTNAFTIAIGLITIFSKEIMEFINGTEKADEATQSLNKSIVEETSNIRLSILILNNKNLSHAEHLRVANELKKIYPKTLENYSAEEIAAGKAAGAIDKITLSLVSLAKAKALQSEIDEKALSQREKEKQREDSEINVAQLRLKLAKQDELISKTNAGSDRLNAMQERRNSLQKMLDWEIWNVEKLKGEYTSLNDEMIALAAKASALKSNVIAEDSPTSGGKDGKEVNRVKELQNQFENELKIQKTAFNNEEMGLIIHLNKMLDITQKYSEKLKSIQSLSKDERDSAIDFELKASDVTKDALGDIREQVLTQMKVPKSKADKITGEAITIPVGVEVEIRINDKDITSLQDVIDTLQKIQSVAQDIGSGVSDISQIYLERDMAALDVKDRRLKEYYDNEIRFIEQSGMAEAAKAKAKARLDAETNARQKKIEIDRITAMRKAARIQKAIDIVEIIANTAKSVTALLKTPPLAIAAAFAGAAQLARVIATPLPQYAEGTDYHKGGSFIAGEKGVEQVILPSGKSFLTPSSATLFPDMPQGTKVINNKDLMQQVYNSAIVKLSTQGQVTPQKMMEAQMMAFEEMTDEVKGLRHDLRAKELTATFSDYAGFRNYKNSNIR